MVILYFLALELATLALAPLIWLMLKRDPAAGHGAGKIISLLAVAYLVFLVGSVGSNYTRGSILLITLALVLASLAAWRTRRVELTEIARRNWRDIVVIEIVFAACFFAFVAFRAYNPEISYDVNLYAAEKFPDMAFFHSLYRSDHLPPPDPWFAGPENFVNYYYYGYFILATVAKLAGTAPEVAYNLSLAAIFGLAVVGAYSLLYTLARRRWVGALGAVFVAVMGNLYGFVQLFAGKPFDALDLWKGSRIIVHPGVDATINEFPAFSFILGDLHAHLLVLPISLAVIYLLASIQRLGGQPLARAERGPRLALAACLLLALGSLITANAWDMPAYLALSAGVLALAGLRSDRPWRGTAAWLLLLAAGVAAVRFGLFAPFYRHYAAPPAKLGLLPAEHRSPIGQFMTIYGFMFVPVLIFLAALAGEALAERRKLTLGALAAGLAAGIGTGLGFASPVVGLLAAMLVWSGFLLFVPGGRRPFQLPVLLVFMGTAVTLGCEFVFIRDFYGGENLRMNTVFKFYYEAWIFFALAAAYGAYYVLQRAAAGVGPVAAWPFKGVLALGLAASLVYPVKAAYVKADRFQPVLGRPTLNGFEYIRQRSPDDYAAIQWLREHAPEGSVVLEATGKPYSYYARVATMSGLPTVLGWGNHESLWRDWTWRSITERTNEIQAIYKELDTRRVLELLGKYGVDYVFVGSLENDDFYEYDQNGKAKFGVFMDKAYDVGQVAIFRRRTEFTPENVPPYQRDAALLTTAEDGKVVVNAEGVKQISARQPVQIIGARGAGPGQLSDPKDMALAPDGSLYVVEAGNHRLSHFAADGKFLGSFGSKGDQPGQFNEPRGVAVDAAGRVYVADTWNHRIQVFDAAGTYVTGWGDGSTFWAPKRIKIGPDGTIYIADTGYHRIHLYSPDYRPIRVFGAKGSDPGQLFEPVGLALGPDNRILVADTGNKRIAAFDTGGRHLADYYVIGWEEFFTEPYLAIDPAGRYLVATDSRNNRLQIYGLDGRLKAVWASAGSGPGQFGWPLGIEFAGDGRLYVVDSLNGRIQVFAAFGEDI